MAEATTAGKMIPEPEGGRVGSSPRSDRALILHAIAQAGQASGSDHPGVSMRVTAADLPEDYFPGYDVLNEIHRGGQGVVYRAVQRSTKRTVAIKLMHGPVTGGGSGGLAASSSGRARFEREVEVLVQLSHPGIVNVHDSGVSADGCLFYVMDYIGGELLDAIIRRWRTEAERVRRDSSTASGASSRAGSRTGSRHASRTTALGAGVLRERLGLFAKVCEGVQAAHVRGVIHRDLKPANVRLDNRGEPVVVDFGLAKLTGPSAAGLARADDDGDGNAEGAVMTATGQFVGSMPWSSPEQAEGAHASVDTRSDVYSLGVILYQIVTGGRFPYVVIGTMRQVMQNILHAEPERPSLIDRGVNDEVETILLKALAKEPARRYQTAGELAADVRRYLAGEPIEAKRDSGWYVITKTVRRHRVPAGFAAALAVVTVGFTVALGFKYAEADDLRQRAETRATAEENARKQAEIERARAEENFAAVRDLARTFMFGFHDEIADLRGATRARAMVAEEAAAYLERLRAQVERDAAPETGLLLELAAAYDRLGEIQEDSASANMTDAGPALASFVEAAAIREIVLGRALDGMGEAGPGVWIEHGRNAVARARVEQKLGRFEEAIASGHEALSHFDSAADAGTSADEVGSARAGAWTLLGDLHHRLSRSARDPIEAFTELDRAAGWYAQAEAWWGAMDEPADGPGREELAYQRAGVRYAIARNADQRAAVAIRHDDPASLGLVESALDAAMGAVEQAERFRAGHPQSRRAQRGLITARRLGSIVWLRLPEVLDEGDPRAAQAEASAFDLARGSYEAALTMAMDTTDAEAQWLLGVSMNALGNTLSALGRLDEAEALYNELIELRRGIYETDPVARSLRDLFVAVWKRARMAQQKAEGSDNAGVQLGHLTEALAGYTEAAALLEELSAMGVDSDREIAVCRRNIEEIESALAGLGAGERP